MFAIETENLKKTFDPPLFSKQQPVCALRGITFNVPQGEIYTLLGPNGSGKTTLLRILAGLIPPTQGDASIHNLSVKNQKALLGKIGLLISGSKGFFGFMSGIENLLFFAALYALKKKEALERIRFLAEKFGLTSEMHKAVRTYSSGIRQRLLLVRALLHDPDVMLMDEPTVHLDPVGCREINHLLQDLVVKDLKKTILLTTHQLDEACEISDTLALIFKGELVWEKPASVFRSGQEHLLEEYLETVHEKLRE